MTIERPPRRNRDLDRDSLALLLIGAANADLRRYTNIYFSDLVSRRPNFFFFLDTVATARVFIDTLIND